MTRDRQNLVLDILRNHMPRRDFLKLTAALSILVTCKSRNGRGSQLREVVTADGLRAPPLQVGQGRKAIVLGGGPAGLCAGYELMRRGFEVTVLERTKRIGGRVWTNYNEFEDGQYCENGATRIPDCHDLTMSYAELFKIPLAPASYDDDDTMYLIDANKPAFLKSKDKARISGIETSYTSGIEATLGDPHASTWPSFAGNSELEPLDRMTFANFLRKHYGRQLTGPSPRDLTPDEVKQVEEMVAIVKASNGSEVDMFSALFWLVGELLELKWDKTNRMQGGNEQLPRAFDNALGARVRKLAQVKSVQSLERGVRVGFVERGDAQTLDADFVVCTLPLDVLKKIDWQPGLSNDKLRASSEVVMQPVTRINLQFRQRFWEAQGVKGLKVLHSTLPIERLWDMTVSQDQKRRFKIPKGEALLPTFDKEGKLNELPLAQGEARDWSQKGILTCYIQSDLAVAAAQKTNDERIQFVLNDIVKVFGTVARETFLRGSTFAWHQQDWVGGGWAAYKPGQADLYQATRKSEGRVYFAGDHTSLEPGWIQGALGSARRVVGEIEEDIKRPG